ncbi:hypothetical protein BEWA_018560 [Theileria equi strain WA]|uniref:Uncharacterized protein n=1 Tax=Theileria equi strain WA TaxID=1537102 RepID=L0AVG6_THEEQ|nr:hypothetical protein BEWA_018560 [Theileria equi strain WA]AFZ79011.1 hypothetical protein BEWA_018560 [Theileria equi strain WA]|eukprot:XP_004828677.1 hypothetical protein BEWA_018560 [Theileria equi strain WA]
MILRCQLEVAIHLIRLRYIENLGPGTFRLFVRVYNKSFGKTRVAIPYTIKHTHVDPKDDDSRIKAAQISDDGGGYLSKAFDSSKGEGEVDINEIAVFRLDIPAFPSYMNDVSLFVDYELLRLDGKKVMNKRFRLFRKQKIEYGQISVNSKVIRIGNIMKGVSDYVPCTFETGNMHTIVHSNVHCYALDFCFKALDPNFVDFQDGTKYEFWNKKLGRKVKKSVRPIYKWFNSSYDDKFYADKGSGTETSNSRKKCSVNKNVISSNAPDNDRIFSTSINEFINKIAEMIIENDEQENLIINLPDNQTLQNESLPDMNKEYGSFDGNIKTIYKSHKKMCESSFVLQGSVVRLVYFLYSKILVMNFYYIGRMVRFLKSEIKKNENANIENYPSGSKSADDSFGHIRDHIKEPSGKNGNNTQLYELETKLRLLEDHKVLEITNAINAYEILEEKDVTFDVSLENEELTRFIGKRLEHITKSLGITKINNSDIRVKINDKISVKIPDITIGNPIYDGSISKLCESIGKVYLHLST